MDGTAVSWVPPDLAVWWQGGGVRAAGRTVLVVGSHPACDLVVPVPGVAPQHLAPCPDRWRCRRGAATSWCGAGRPCSCNA
jgi:hypothetical protein